MPRTLAALSVLALPLAAAAAAAATYPPEVSPSTVRAGQPVTVHGSVDHGCQTPGQVTLYSEAFRGATTHDFAGVPAVLASANGNGSFSIRVAIRRSLRPGRYLVGGRCGGGNFGSATVKVVPAAGGRAGRGSAAVVAPPGHARFDYQIGGAYPPPAGVVIVERDRAARPAAGLYNVCYVNAYQTQPGETAWWITHQGDLLLRRRGRPVGDPAYRDELLLDTSTAAKRQRIARILGRWIDGCAAAGFAAVEPDNLDSWTRSGGQLTRRGNLALASLLIARAHARGLAIAQKNTAELGSAGRRLGFDFAVAEECGAYHECGVYIAAFGARVIEIEYPDNGGRANFLAACRDRAGSISITYRDRAVAPRGRPGYVDEAC